MTLGAAILSYLSRRPIAPIVEKSNEKNNVRALQLMCIVDHHMGQRKMYDRFAGHPKMLTQLLQFHSFVSFKYYDYRANSKMFQKLMQCKFCELIGPCTLILTHMSMNHNTHIGLKTCIFCNRTDFADHLKTNTGLDDCYHEYKTKYNEIEELSKDHNLLNAIVDFYEMLNAISSRLNVCILRTHGFAGSGHKVTEKLQRNYGDDLDSECIVFNVRNTKHKQLDSSKLRKEFNDIVKTMRDNEITHFLSPRAIKSEDSIQIVDDDDIDLQPAQSGFENQLNQSGLENQSLQSDQLGSENQTLQSDQSGLDLSFVLVSNIFLSYALPLQ